MEKIWNGAFIKHRLGTGDIRNHLEVTSIVPLSEDDYTALLSDDQDRTEVPGGEYAFLVSISWIAGIGTDYEFIVWSSEPELDEEHAKDAIAHEITP